ncbi:2,5-diamino-6-(ribosylamino)-4(3H)-pyrimidinone 5'-phosphate reductase [Dimargaris xerosporica]|nr:2,5-diamino-6-(ribosylamino)-4(3H)-pyrimidinone 5'-phosphate reductase [Dimargaris xerosporica]
MAITLTDQDWAAVESFVSAALALPLASQDSDPALPQVTLTFAQTLDGKIAGRQSKPMLLSGPQSMAMTHRLRCLHDGILVGVQTVINDDPRLTARIVQPGQLATNPRPIVLDTHLRIPLTCRLLTSPASDPSARSPWVIAGGRCDPAKRQTLERIGARVIMIPESVIDPRTNCSRLDIPSLLKQLRSAGLERIMIEGGATVIAEFWQYFTVHAAMLGISPLCILTVAPHYVGQDGLALGWSRSASMQWDALPALRPALSVCDVRQLGKDVVMTGRICAAPLRRLDLDTCQRGC